MKKCPFCGELPDVTEIVFKNEKIAKCRTGDCPIWNVEIYLEKWEKRLNSIGKPIDSEEYQTKKYLSEQDYKNDKHYFGDD